jgi:hypothetical protein
MKVNSKFSATILSILIVGLIVLIGPVQALVLNLTSSVTSVILGQNINFIGEVELNSDEDIHFLILELDGPVSVACTFLPDGTKITSCNGITIDKIGGGLGYGYGYGYGDRDFKYSIDLDTTNYPKGVYKSKLIALKSDGDFSSEDGPTIEIIEAFASLQKCSVRAQGGEGVVGDTDFYGSKLNFNVPNSEAANGRGSIVAQEGRDRFSYKFEVLNVLANNNEEFVLRVRGDYRIGRESKVNEVSTLTFHKDTQEVDLINDIFSFEKLRTTLVNGC